MPERSLPERTLLRSAWNHPYAMAVSVALAVGAMAFGIALVEDLPVRDPDGLFGPSYVRLPVIVALVLAVDVLPRAVLRAPSVRGLLPAAVEVVRSRWPWSRLGVVMIGMGSFYLTYVAYRNLKSFLPFLREDLYDVELAHTDLLVAGGIHPAELLHTLLGTTVSAAVLSFVYLAFLFFVPVSLAVALVWVDDVRRGSWYVSALCLNWVLGVASYYVLPALGPIYTQPWLFADLQPTGTTGLQAALMGNRIEVLADPWATGSVHGIAAFASLHVSIVFTAALTAQLMRLHTVVRTGLWAFFGLTVLATVYFGWHYVVDDVAGVAIGAATVAIAGYATGQWPGRAVQGVDDHQALPQPRKAQGDRLAAEQDRGAEQDADELSTR